MRPKLPFRFKVDFYTGLDINDTNLTYCVTNITLPKIEGQASEGSLYLGNTIFTVPVWNLSSRKLDITFEETDTMLVSQFIDKLYTLSYGRCPWYITIVVSQYEEHMRDEETPKYETGDKASTAYICHLSSYDEPSFRREGSVTQVTMSASFIIDSVIDNWTEKSGVFAGQKNEKEPITLNNDLTTLTINIQNEEFTFGDKKWGSSTKPDITVYNRKLEQFKMTDNIGNVNKNRDANYDALLARMKEAGINRNDTTEVVNYLRKEGYITDSYQKGINGLCATSTYLVAAITSGQEKLGDPAGHGDKQNLSAYGYKDVETGSGAAALTQLLKDKKLQVGDVINITYANGDPFGHAVTVIENPDGTLGFVSDYVQGSIHGQKNEARVGSWRIQRRA